MENILPEGLSFTFQERPIPVPGDLRISWRIVLGLLMLVNSRGGKASLAKLHVLNDALRSKAAKEKLIKILDKEAPFLTWKIRVEPAFGRAIDFMIGEKFAEWCVVTAGRAGLKITDSGKAAVKSVEDLTEVMCDEKAFLDQFGGKVTERFVHELVSVGRER